MTYRKYFFALALVVAGCADPEAARRLDADIEAAKERISQAQDERKAFGKGSVVHDLISMRIAIQQQTLAMLEQRREAEKWHMTLSYTVDGKPYTPPVDSIARMAALQARLKNAREGRESDLQLMRGSADAVRPLYVTSIATKTILMAQLEYQLAAHASGFPPYYTPFHPSVSSAMPPTAVEVPAGKTTIVR